MLLSRIDNELNNDKYYNKSLGCEIIGNIKTCKEYMAVPTPPALMLYELSFIMTIYVSVWTVFVFICKLVTGSKSYVVIGYFFLAVAVCTYVWHLSTIMDAIRFMEDKEGSSISSYRQGDYSKHPLNNLKMK